MWRAVAFALVLMPAAAFAQSPDAGTDAETLQADLDRSLPATRSADCAEACRALESMRRAADRLCAIEPGDRCERAREKLREASARVKAACSECASAVATPPAPPSKADVYQETVATQRGGGGCGGCATSPRTAPAGALVLGGLAALAVIRRRRARRTPSARSAR